MPKPVTDGPLPLPAPPGPRLALVVNRLRGHATSPSWLPVGLDPEVDRMRLRQLAQRDRLASALVDLSGAEVAFAGEDRNRTAGLIAAQRTGKPVAADERTPQVEREAVLRDLNAVVWAAAEVMAEVVTEALDTLSGAEPRILAGLRERAAQGDERIGRAQREVVLAQQDHFALLKQGQWLQATVDQGPFGLQPAPVSGPMPPNVSRAALAGALERPWHRQPNGAAA